jgi:hypothetical protein
VPFLLQVDLTNPTGSWFADADEDAPVAEAALGTLVDGFTAGDPVAAADEVDGQVDADGGDGGVETAVLEFRVLYSARHARIAAVVDVEDFEAASSIAVALGRHVCMYSPDIMDWRLTGVQVTPLAGPFDGERWLPDPALIGEPRHDLAEQLPRPVVELGSRYLLAGAVRNLWDRSDTDRSTVPVDWLLSGADDLPWSRDLGSALTELLTLARRVDDLTGRPGQLVPGPGDDALAADLLTRVRAVPVADVADDDLAMYHVIEDWTAAHALEHRRMDDQLDPTMQRFRDTTNHRAVLAAGVRVLAPLLHHLDGRATSTLNLLGELAPAPLERAAAQLERDTRAEDSRQDSEAVARVPLPALAARLALAAPNALTGDAGEELVDDLAYDADDEDLDTVHFLVYWSLVFLGRTAVAAASPTRPGARALAAAVLPLLHDPDERLDDDDESVARRADDDDTLHAALEHHLQQHSGDPYDDDDVDDEIAEAIADALELIAAARRASGQSSAELVLGLLRDPLEMTAADTSTFADRALITAVWRAMLAEALSRFGADVAVTVSGFLPELHSADPREEEPLRTEAAVRAVAHLLPPGRTDAEDIAAVFAPDPR